MSRQGTHWDSGERVEVHREKVLQKIATIDGKKALLEMWEADPNVDQEYLLALRARVRSLENQLSHMLP